MNPTRVGELRDESPDGAVRGGLRDPLAGRDVEAFYRRLADAFASARGTDA